MDEKSRVKVSNALRIGYYLSTLSAAALLFSAFLATHPSGAGLPAAWLLLGTTFFTFFGFQALAFCLAFFALIQILRQRSRGINLLIITFVSVALYTSLAFVFYRRLFGTG